MAWLPGHTCVGSAVDVVYVQISPARLTTAPHLLSPWNNPPASPPAAGAAARKPFSAPSSGRPWHLPCDAAETADPRSTSEDASAPPIMNPVAFLSSLDSG